jgi:hypothetical protein
MISRGMAVGLNYLTNFKFDPAFPYAGCKLCGELFQSDANRMGSEQGLSEWRLNHNKQHQDHEHVSLIRSGRRFTPEAAQRLAPYGIIDFWAILSDPETAHAYATADRAPNNDVEGS